MSEPEQHYQEPLSSRIKWVLITFIAIGAFFLFAEHRAHVLPYLPWLLLGSCLLMHSLMHGGHGHGGHGDQDGHQAGSERTARAASPAENSYSDHSATVSSAVGTGSAGLQQAVRGETSTIPTINKAASHEP